MLALYTPVGSTHNCELSVRLEPNEVLLCRYIAGTPHVKLSARTTMHAIFNAAAGMFAAAQSPSSADPNFVLCTECLFQVASSARGLEVQLDTVHALRIAHDEAGINIDMAQWHAVLFDKSLLTLESRPGSALDQVQDSMHVADSSAQATAEAVLTHMREALVISVLEQVPFP